MPSFLEDLPGYLQHLDQVLYLGSLISALRLSLWLLSLSHQIRDTRI